MDELQSPITPPEQPAVQGHLKKHKNKYIATGLVAALIAAALQLLPDLQELAKLEIQQAISRLQDAGH